MTEQQYRVVADRSSMADDSWIAEGDRVTYGSVSSTGELVIFRIERPVPTTDEPAADEVVIDGNVFNRADLPDLLKRHMRALDDAQRREKQHWIDHHELLALLSQPTPTAESRVSICDCGHARGEHWGPDGQCTMTDCGCWGHVHREFFGQPAASPRIEDMAPGTTFTAAPAGWFPTRFKIAESGRILSEGWRLTTTVPEDFDPSTIRDVTPPAGA